MLSRSSLAVPYLFHIQNEQYKVMTLFFSSFSLRIYIFYAYTIWEYTMSAWARLTQLCLYYEKSFIFIFTLAFNCHFIITPHTNTIWERKTRQRTHTHTRYNIIKYHKINFSFSSFFPVRNNVRSCSQHVWCVSLKLSK